MSHRYRTPANALTAMVVVAWLFTVAAFLVGKGTAVVIVTAVTTLGTKLNLAFTKAGTAVSTAAGT